MKKEHLINDSFTNHFKPSLRQYLRQLAIWVKHPRALDPDLKNSVQFLYGHHLFEDEIKGLHKLTEFLKNNFKIISYSEAVEKVRTGIIDNRYICFSFDDGIKNTQRIAKHFFENEISAMFFLNPKVVDMAGNENWCANHSQNRLNKKPLDFFDWKDVEWLQKCGHEIGNHTLNHVNLARVKEEELQQEIAEAKMQLELKCGSVKHFSWPYGLKKDITKQAFELIHKSGHSSVSSAIRGQHFNQLNLEKEFILRDQLVYFEHAYFFNYFYSINNKATNASLIL